MPRLEVEGVGAFDVEEGKRLVLAIEEDAGVDILQRSVRNRKIDGAFYFRAVVTEHSHWLVFMKGVRSA